MAGAPGRHRRNVLASAGAGASAAALGGAPALAQTGQRKTFVLVHGAWHGGWCWRRVSDLLEKRGHKVFTPTMTGLGERAHLLDDKVNLGNSILRIIHYPPMPPEPTPSVRAGAHEDINVITLLLGAEEPGLEVLSKKGEWLPINPAPGSLVCNVGDMLQRLSNNRLCSTTHRVVNPPKELWHTSRFSIPFFLHPKSNMSLNCLPGCVDEHRPKSFADITAGEYLDERLREIGLKK